MYCRYCGKEIDEDSVYCTHCGKSQNEMQPQPTPLKNTSQEEIETESYTSYGKVGCLQAFGVLIIIGLVVGVFNLLNESTLNTVKSSHTQQTSKSSTKTAPSTPSKTTPEISVLGRGFCTDEFGGLAACITVKNNSKTTKIVYADVNIQQGNTVVDSTITNTLSLNPGQTGVIRAHIFIAASGFSYKVHNY